MSESAQTQARIPAAAAEAASSPVETGEDADIGASGGTTGETEALTAALSDFSRTYWISPLVVSRRHLCTLEVYYRT